MLVIEVALALFTLSVISQFLKVRLRQRLFMDRLYQIRSWAYLWKVKLTRDDLLHRLDWEFVYRIQSLLNIARSSSASTINSKGN